jgi:Na+/H+ antiporter NhaD/arsenite permease-like protein
MAVYIFVIKLIWGKKLKTMEELKKRIMQMDEREAIKDPAMLKKSLIVLTAVFAGFVFHGALNFQPATIALFGAGLLLLLSKNHDLRHVLAEIEWPTIFFFIGLFIIVGGVVKVGLIKWMSIQVLNLTQGNLFATSMVVMWFSAFASAIIDNIPYVATMNPLIINMAEQMWPGISGTQLLHHPALMPLWWSLALGACLGGNGTAIGASANVIVVGVSEKTGNRITFLKFMAYGMPVMIITVIIATVYVWLRYYVFGV